MTNEKETNENVGCKLPILSCESHNYFSQMDCSENGLIFQNDKISTKETIHCDKSRDKERGKIFKSVNRGEPSSQFSDHTAQGRFCILFVSNSSEQCHRP